MGRRKRFVARQTYRSREKRALVYACNDSMVFGVQLKDLYDQPTITADRCCCPHFRGELFNLFVTILLPWSDSLGDERSAFYKETLKMVEQEVSLEICISESISYT